jgi:hypothetical protein
MKTEIIFAGEVHKVIVQDYINILDVMILEITNESQYNQFEESLNNIVDYHNGYGDKDEANYYDWLMLLPINVSVLAQGMFVGLETDANRADVRGFKTILDMELQTVVENLSAITRHNA